MLSEPAPLMHWLCSGCWQVVSREVSLTPPGWCKIRGEHPWDLLPAVDQGREVSFLMTVLPEAAAGCRLQGIWRYFMVI